MDLRQRSDNRTINSWVAIIPVYENWIHADGPRSLNVRGNLVSNVDDLLWFNSGTFQGRQEYRCMGLLSANVAGGNRDINRALQAHGTQQTSTVPIHVRNDAREKALGSQLCQRGDYIAVEDHLPPFAEIPPNK